MSESGSNRTIMPPRRVFGAAEDSALDADDASPVRVPGTPQPNQTRRPSATGRVSFSKLPHRPSFVSRLRNITGDEEAGEPRSPKPERPAIPSALQPPPEVYSTPLPTLSMIVLSITMLGEFLCANVSAPFLLFMVESFDQFENEADVGYWTGLLVSTFFLTQFLTSLLWATVAAKHGQRLVIGISLFGSAVTCVMFGTAKSIQQAMAIRLMQGVFSGAIGVARGAVPAVTDQSNEGRAYAILGFCWGLGGVAGAIVGGSFENPAKKWPGTFNTVPLFVNYPYLLPCIVASSVTLLGSFLSLFLGPDCGPREGAIFLPAEKLSNTVSTIPEEPSPPVSPTEENAEPRGIIGSIGRKVSRKFSGIFASRVPDGGIAASASIPVPLATAPSRPRGMSHSAALAGSAYGYNGSYRARLASHGTIGPRRWSMAASARRRRESNAHTISGEQPMSTTGTDMNFAQRLLMANENAVTGIADLWVAAAMNPDNEEVFEDEDEWQTEQESEQALMITPGEEFNEADMFDSTPTPRANRFVRRPSLGSPSLRTTAIGSPRNPSTSQQRDSPARVRRFSNALGPSASDLDSVPQTPARRYSTATAPIFSHVGVRTPPAVVEAQQLLALADEADAAGAQDMLAPILEGTRPSQLEPTPVPVVSEPSLMSQLPLLIIFQYGILALHSTTHDQVFYLYLVSKYPSGGLNLNAGHFSQLIALMCLVQVVYQFYFYPNIGPPRGRFSHLAMFRIGSLLFIPAYLSVALYRVFASASDDGNFILMCALAISTAIRYCAITFAYTAVSVLLNYMSPPQVVGYANGIAQSIVSLARFCGPVLGGLIWSMSVQDNPTGYPLGFIICSATCGLAVAHSFFIR